jgi:hypothetical protein
MNQINIDSLLQIGSSTKIDQTLKLDASQLYQALLQIGRDQDARLTIQTPQGPLQLTLPTPAALQMQATSQQLIAASNANLPSTPSAPSAAQAVPVELSNNLPTETKLLVQIQPLGTEQLLLTVRHAGKPLHIALQAGQLLQLLQQPAPGPAQHFSVQAQQIAGQTELSTLQWPVQISRQGQQVQIQLPQGQLLQVSQALLPEAKLWPEQKPLSARLELQVQGGQLSIQLRLTDVGQSPVSAASTALTSAASPSSANSTQLTSNMTGSVVASNSPYSPTIAKADHATSSRSAAAEPRANPHDNPRGNANANASNTQHTLQSASLNANLTANPPAGGNITASAAALALKPALQQQLLPLLARASWPEQLGSDVRNWLAAARVTAPSTGASSWQWQLKQPSAQQIQLELIPQAEPRQLKLSVSEIGRPLHFLAQQTTATSAAPTPKIDSRDLWRQWLPLSQTTPDLLADSPTLPPAVRQLLQEIRSQHPDAAKLQSQQQLMQQLSAALQFNPLQMPAQPNSAAGGLAIAIQLLLGRLGAQLPADRQPVPQKEKLQQLIGQLDRSQSAQLLRQLSGHSSQLQSAQIANLEQQASPTQAQKPEQQLLIQLPLLQHGESRFTELAISEREADGSRGNSKQRCWQLTMKFDLGSQGEMLVQVRLLGKEVSLQFYADNEKTVQDTGQFLPLFKDRLTMQGLQVAEAGCQLGKIPEHLYQRGTSLLQVRV